MIRAVFLLAESSLKFGVAVALGLGLSMAVILSALGLMDGFEKTLKDGLRKSGGDIVIKSRKSFFSLEGPLERELAQHGPMTGLLEVQGFALLGEKAKGVLIRGVDPKGFEAATSLNIPLAPNKIAIGREMALFFGLEKGDTLILSAMGAGRDAGDLPTLKEFVIAGVVFHGIYEKDLRYVYMNREDLGEFIGALNGVNGALIKTEAQEIEPIVDILKGRLGDDFSVLPFWSEFSILLKAVHIEKLMIGLILQVIVIVAVFNVLAYIVFLKEKRSKEIFLFYALGLSQKKLIRSWFLLVTALWSASCLVAYALYHLMKYAIEYFSSVSLPGEIYYLTGLKLSLSGLDTLLVFSLSFFWMAAVSYFNLRPVKKEALAVRLKQEFA